MKKIFIDGGARIAESFDIINSDMPQYSNFEFILYEPHPNHTDFLENLSKEKNFKFVNGAIRTYKNIGNSPSSNLKLEIFVLARGV